MLDLRRERAQRGHELKTSPYLINGLRCTPSEAASMQHDLDSIDRYRPSGGLLLVMTSYPNSRTFRLSFSFMVGLFHLKGAPCT